MNLKNISIYFVCLYFVYILSLFCLYFVFILSLFCLYFVFILSFFVFILSLFCLYFVFILSLFCLYFVFILSFFCLYFVLILSLFRPFLLRACYFLFFENLIDNAPYWKMYLLNYDWDKIEFFKSSKGKTNLRTKVNELLISISFCKKIEIYIRL